MLHKLDGKLIAFSVLVIGQRYLKSGYFMYDPEYKFLNLGVMSVIREIEYMRMDQKKFNQDLQYLNLSDMVITCPKTNYKLNYQPGLIKCPKTHRLLPYDSIKDKIRDLAAIPIAEKI